MATATEQLDRRLKALIPLTNTVRPARGWIRAIREALGMTTGQFASRLGVQQPRVSELERTEADGNITVRSLERAADALGCRLVYVLVPEKPLTEVVAERASKVAQLQLSAVEQSMKLEAQTVTSKNEKKAAHQQLVEKLLRHKARLWDKE